MHTATVRATGSKKVNSALSPRAFRAFVVLAVLSLVIALAGKWLGKSIAMAGYTDDPTVREVVIGDNVLNVPSNMIRFSEARHDGVEPRLDLYLRWPTMKGYTRDAGDDFNHLDGKRDILFLTFERRSLPQDMSARFGPIYSALIRGRGRAAGPGLTLYDFKPGTGYTGERLAVAQRPGREPFVARCLGAGATDWLAPCERDVQVSRDMSLTYRFPVGILSDWQRLDRNISAVTARLVKTGK